MPLILSAKCLDMRSNQKSMKKKKKNKGKLPGADSLLGKDSIEYKLMAMLNQKNLKIMLLTLLTLLS